MPSLMNKGVAKAWKDRYIDSRTGQDLTTTWDAFKMALLGSFANPGSAKDAMKTLQNIQQGKNSIDVHNTQFKLLLAKAEINPIQQVILIIELYNQLLNDNIQRQIILNGTISDTLDAYMLRASTLDCAF